MDELISRRALLEAMKQSLAYRMKAQGMDKAVGMVQNAPTIDAVEVVRCAKCAEFDDGTCRLLGLRTVYNDFCSYGYCDEGARMDAEGEKDG